MLRKHIIEWAENAWFISCIENGLNKATKTIERRRMKNGFDGYKQKVKEIKREEYVISRVKWFDIVRNKKTTAIVLDAWQYYVRRFKNARTFLIRSVKGVDRLISNEAFTVWKGVYFQARRDVYTSNIQEL